MMRSALPILAMVVLLGPSVAFADSPEAPGEAIAAPAPPSEIAPPVGPPAPATPSGQWVYTSQYGWVWMPYDPTYTYVSPDAANAYMFVYYPAIGWSWVGAPWILGVGPAPYWGRFGVAHFAWYAHPWFRVGASHPVGGGFGHTAMGHGFYGGGGFHGGGGGHGHR